MTKYKAPKYISNLKFDKVPADADWEGIINPLTLYDRIYATKENYEYPDLYSHFDKISPNGKRSLGAALHEWIINRIAKEYGKDITYFYPVIEAYWAASIDKCYGGCEIPDFEYELINNQTERKNGEPAFIKSYWPAKGNLQNILYSSMVFVEYLEDVNTGPNKWLESLYYLALYLMPDNIKPVFQQWFRTALDRLEKYTPNRSVIGKYEDLFDEYWAENRGLPIPPQLLDPEFDYKSEQNTQLVHKFISKLNYKKNRYLNDLEVLIENRFDGTPYTFTGLIEKEKKTVDLNSLASTSEDLSSLTNPPAIIKASDKALNRKFLENDELRDELEMKYTDDRDGYANVDYSKLSKVLDTIELNILKGLALSATEWIIHLLKDFTDTRKTEMLLESMWAKKDVNYLKVVDIELEDETDEDECSAGEDLVKIAVNKLLLNIDKGYECVINLLVLARDIQTDRSIYDAWLDNAIKRIKTDFPQSKNDRKDEDESTLIISRNYFFNTNAIYNELEVKKDLKIFISKLNYAKNSFLPTPEEVYLMSYITEKPNENPYNQNYEFSKDITPEKISILGNELSVLGKDKLALKCFDTAEKLDPEDRFSYAYRGLYYYQNDENKLAIDYFSKAVSIQPGYTTCYYLGASYYELKDYDKAYDAFVQSIGLNENINEEKKITQLSDEFADLSSDAIMEKKYDLAIELANKAIVLNPENAAAYLNRGVGYTYKGDLEKYKADTEMVRKLNPERAARTYINESVTLNKQGEYQLALDKGLIALPLIDKKNKDSDEELCDIYQEMGYAYGQLEIFDKALEYMTKAIELDDSDGLRFANRAFYLRTFGRFEEALEDYDKAIKILPKNWMTFICGNRGKAYAGLKLFKEALSDWKTAYNISKALGELIYIIYGQVSCGKVKDAKKTLDKALKMDDCIEDDDELLYNFIQYALQINIDEALSRCEDLLEKDVSNKDYPLGEFVQVIIDKRHPNKEMLVKLAEKINRVSALK